MTDKELLELAARAAGIVGVDGVYPIFRGASQDWNSEHWTEWNPLADDGDALRLAVKLKLQISFGNRHVSVFDEAGFVNFQTEVLAHRGNDAATRRAITRAAAEIGKAKCE